MGSLLLILFLVVPRGSSLVRHDEVGAPFTAPGADLGGRAHGMRCPRGGRPLWMTSRCRADGRDGHGPLPEQDDGGSWGREDASEEHETHGEVLQAGDGGDGDGGWYGQFGHDGRGNAHPPPCHAHAGEGSHGSISPRRERGRQCWRDHWQGCGEDDCEERAHEHGGRGPAQLSGKDRGPRHRRWGLCAIHEREPRQQTNISLRLPAPARRERVGVQALRVCLDERQDPEREVRGHDRFHPRPRAQSHLPQHPRGGRHRAVPGRRDARSEPRGHAQAARKAHGVGSQRQGSARGAARAHPGDLGFGGAQRPRRVPQKVLEHVDS
mmetsp:Transcript_25293/g.79987  ORF Transcript_25293/g.79987 Transcript_25293/m.79987 type:complete len:324 (+) Transcript_25293:425-1396(+)